MIRPTTGVHGLGAGGKLPPSSIVPAPTGLVVLVATIMYTLTESNNPPTRWTETIGGTCRGPVTAKNRRYAQCRRGGSDSGASRR